MTEIDELQKELENLKKIKKEKDLQEKFEEAKSYINKCYSTHYFGHNYFITNTCIIRILDVFIEDEKIQYSYQNIYLSVTKQNQFSFSSNIFHTDDINNIISIYFKNKIKEISLTKFIQISELSKAHIENFNNILKINKFEIFNTNGECNESEAKAKLLERTKTKLIKIEDDTIICILRWHNCPFLINNYLLDIPETYKCIQLIIDDLLNNATIWRNSSVDDRDTDRANQLKTFLIEINGDKRN